MRFLFFLGLFFFPFNSFKGLDYLGEFKNESGAYFFVVGFIVLVFSKNIYIPFKNKIFIVLMFFVLWCFVCTLLNLNTVNLNYFKHTTGLNRFIRQYFSLIISSTVFFLFYCNVLYKMSIKEIIFKIRKVFLFSLSFALVLGSIELLAEVYGVGIAGKLIKFCNFFPFLEKELIDNRVSAFADEPPFFAVYLITIAGWMFSYILTSKSVFKYFPAFGVLLLTFYSGSRTAFIVVTIQFLLFLPFVISKNQILVSLKYFAVSIVVISIGTLTFGSTKFLNDLEKKVESLDFSGNLKKNISNQSRFGMQVAALQVFKSNPITGVGFGQVAYHARKHYPGWATRDNYEFTLWYKNPALKAFPPSYNMYTRLLAEVGIVGFIIFCTIIIFVVKGAKQLIKNNNFEIKTLGIILLICFVGLFINLLQIDTFRLYGIWISIALLIVVQQKTKQLDE
jgi:O-antigen ligase